MNPSVLSRVRPFLPSFFPNAPLLTFFLIFEVPLLYLEWRAGRRADLPYRPGTFILFIVAAIHGFARTVTVHPVFLSGYRTWLESTPWTYRKPLPLGSVELSGRDGVFLGVLILLSATQPQPHAVLLLCTFLTTHLLALTCSLWLTRSWASGYTTAFALGLAVWFWRQPLVCLASLSGVYLIAYEGLRQAMASFPWKRRKIPKLSDDMSTVVWKREPCGWPHDQMMGQVVEDSSISRIDAVLGCMLGTWWFYVLISLIPKADRRVALSVSTFTAVMAVAPFLRLGVFVAGYSSPISVWGRIWTSRWIIPGYDRVFVAPLCAWIAGPATLVFLQACTVPEPTRYLISAAMVVLVAILTPPRLRQWRLTGQHRIMFMFGGTNQQKTFMKVR